MSTSLWPARIRVVRGPGRIRLLLDRRAVAVWILLGVVVALVGTTALTLGETNIAPGQVLPALAGRGESATVRVVTEWRLPRVVLAVVGGACLGLSGAVFQSMTRNPLGSPDIIGFSTGAYTGALVVSLVLDSGAATTQTGAFVGGLATALAVYLLAYRRGVQGFRLVVVGIAVSAVLGAVNAYLLVRASLEEAVTAALWGAGTLNGARWQDVAPVLVGAAVLVPLCLLLARRITVLELGDEHAQMLGVAVEPLRVVLLVVGVGLVSVITAVAGPITFIALAAPQIAKRLARATGPALLTSALTGGLLLLLGDVIAQRVVAPGQLPVGVVTACLGGVYLVWLLTRAGKERA